MTPGLLTVALLVASWSAARAREGAARFINPPGLVRPTGYTHVVVAARWPDEGLVCPA